MFPLILTVLNSLNRDSRPPILIPISELLEKGENIPMIRAHAEAVLPLNPKP